MILIEIHSVHENGVQPIRVDEIVSLPEIHYNGYNQIVPSLNISPIDTTEAIYIKGRTFGRLGWNSIKEFLEEIY